MIIKNILPISVIIPTLGGDTLNKTINNFNSCNTIVSEILICIPKQYLSNLKIQNINNNNNNLNTIITSESGQVLQRSIGFKNSKQPFVLQLDDDIEITINDIENLMCHIIKLDESSAIGPQYFDNFRNKFYYKSLQGWQYLESMLVDFLIGYAKLGDSRMGTISGIGKNYGFDIEKMNYNIKKVEWLAGGCVLHNRKNLITDNYYPFTGKAYCEDIIHSILLNKKGIKLWICKDVICKISDKPKILDILESNKEQNAIEYIIKMKNGNIFLLKLNKMYWNTRNAIKNFFFK